MTNVNYIVATALRGPDMQSPAANEIKRIVTARLRAIVYRGLKECGMVLYCENPIEPKHLRELKRSLKNLREQNLSHQIEHGKLPRSRYKRNEISAYTHWLRHLAGAVEQTRRNQIWGQKGKQIVKLLENTLSHYDSLV